MSLSDNARHPARRLALMGMLLAIASAISFAESCIPLPLPLGVKPGLASIVVMYALLHLDTRAAWTLTLLKSGFVLLTRGATAGLLSLGGGVCALLVMLLLVRLLKSSMLLMSVGGGIAHNLGQLCISMLLMQTTAVAYYLPVLILAGGIAGAGTGTCLRLLIPVLTGSRHPKQIPKN